MQFSTQYVGRVWEEFEQSKEQPCWKSVSIIKCIITFVTLKLIRKRRKCHGINDTIDDALNLYELYYL